MIIFLNKQSWIHIKYLDLLSDVAFVFSELVAALFESVARVEAFNIVQAALAGTGLELFDADVNMRRNFTYYVRDFNNRTEILKKCITDKKLKRTSTSKEKDRKQRKK